MYLCYKSNIENEFAALTGAPGIYPDLAPERETLTFHDALGSFICVNVFFSADICAA